MLTQEEWTKLNKLVSAALHCNRNLRVGQAWFNALYDVRSDIACSICGGDADPFYKDENLGAFFEYITPTKGE